MVEAVEFGGHRVDFGDDGIIHWRTAEVIRTVTGAPLQRSAA